MSTSAEVLLSDGAIASIRLLAPGDAAGLHELHERASDESIWLRFFALDRSQAHRYVDQVLAAPDTIALVATLRDRIVGFATAEPLEPGTSEVALLIADEMRGHGVGMLLLEHLAALARDRGINRFSAEVLAENHRMLHVFADAGFALEHGQRGPHGSVRTLTLDIAVTAAAQRAADDREFAAEARSLAPLLAPTSVAVYGVRKDGSGVGGAVLSAIRAGGFAGRVVVVRPLGGQVAGGASYPTLRAAGEPVDLAVIAVPARGTVAALEDAAAGGVRAAVVISSGFSELGAEGDQLQQRLARTARLLGVRLVGPNCLGLLCNDPATALNATFTGSVPPPGGLALASQSGGVGIVLMHLAGTTGVGLHTFVSLGNKADVSSNDLLAAWYDDPAITCAALYLESFGNARKFARFARRFSERKPLVAVVGGRSAGGRRAGASHTAAAASPAVGVRALFAQAGVIACDDAEQLAETSYLLTREPLPRGRRVGIVSNAGGLGVLAADAADAAGLEVTEFSLALQERLGRLVHGTTGTSNPVDTGAGADPRQVVANVEAMVGSGEVDAVVVVLVQTATADLEETLRALEPLGGRERPVLVVPLGGEVTRSADVTTFLSTGAAMGALGRAWRYAEWRGTDPGEVVPSDPTQVRAARTVAQGLAAGAVQSSGWVSPAGAQDLLGRYGLELVGRIAAAHEAAGVAAQLGFPVAVKVADPAVVHKTERGLVRTGLGDVAAVRGAVADFQEQCGAGVAVLVQPMATGVEIALGIVRDPSLGPLVMVAAGGVATDVWADRSFLVPPFGPQEALRALRTLRIWPLLEGFRGTAPAATQALAETVAALGRLAVDVPEVAELDLNPVLVGPDRLHLVDAKLRVVGGDELGAEQPRQLRPTAPVRGDP